MLRGSSAAKCAVGPVVVVAVLVGCQRQIDGAAFPQRRQ